MAFQCIDRLDMLTINLNVFKLLQVELKLVDYFLTSRILWKGLKLKLGEPKVVMWGSTSYL